jgi:uncharacterized membrane protein YhhN
LCLAFIATLSLLTLGQGLLGRPWQYIVVGLLLFALSDLIYVYGEWNEMYATGSNVLSGITDTVYLAAYMVTISGAHRQANFALPGFAVSED